MYSYNLCVTRANDSKTEAKLVLKLITIERYGALACVTEWRGHPHLDFKTLTTRCSILDPSIQWSSTSRLDPKSPSTQRAVFPSSTPDAACETRHISGKLLLAVVGRESWEVAKLDIVESFVAFWFRLRCVGGEMDVACEREVGYGTSELWRGLLMELEWLLPGSYSKYVLLTCAGCTVGPWRDD